MSCCNDSFIWARPNQPVTIKRCSVLYNDVSFVVKYNFFFLSIVGSFGGDKTHWNIICFIVKISGNAADSRIAPKLLCRKSVSFPICAYIKTPGRSSPQGTEHLGGTTLINTADVLPAVVLSFIFNADIRCIFIQSSGAGSMCSCKGFHQPPSLWCIPHIYYSLSSPVCICDFTQNPAECQPKPPFQVFIPKIPS